MNTHYKAKQIELLPPLVGVIRRLGQEIDGPEVMYILDFLVNYDIKGARCFMSKEISEAYTNVQDTVCKLAEIFTKGLEPSEEEIQKIQIAALEQASELTNLIITEIQKD